MLSKPQRWGRAVSQLFKALTFSTDQEQLFGLYESRVEDPIQVHMPMSDDGAPRLTELQFLLRLAGSVERHRAQSGTKRNWYGMISLKRGLFLIRIHLVQTAKQSCELLLKVRTHLTCLRIMGTNIL